MRCDVTSWEDQQALVERAITTFGRLDVFFANAGFGAKRGFLEETRGALEVDDRHQRLRRRPVDPRRAGPLQASRTAGHLVLTSSVAGRRALPGSLYSATKWAVTAMGEACARRSPTPTSR